jgi:2-phospho-L-lactate guanylyltransferase
MPVIAVPVKSLERSKTRLSPVLEPMERAALTLAMFEDVLDATLAHPGWDVWVVSAAEAVLEISSRRGARPVAEEGHSLLDAVRQVEGLVRPRDGALAVVLADLPLITREGLAGALTTVGRSVAAAPSRDGGTNVLVRRPHSVIPARFGPASFSRHRSAARRAGIGFRVVRSAALGFDLDRPEDVAGFMAHPVPGRTANVCRELGLAPPARVGSGP